MKKFIHALATLLGTVIGVGLFGLPYVSFKSGFLLVLGYFLILSLVVTLIHLFFGEITMTIPGQRRLPGYAEIYLGIYGKRIAFFISSLAIIGALTAYLLVGGQFFFILLSNWISLSELVSTLIYFTAGALLIYFGIKTIANVELFMLLFFFLILIIFFIFGWPQINVENLINITFKIKNFILPYGIVLFSLWGVSIIPEVKEILKEKANLLRHLIIIGTAITLLTYILFIVIILGICGQDTTLEAISGLKNYLGPKVLTLGLIFGILTTFTSFLTLGLTLKKILWYDFKFNRNLAWALSCFIPLILYFLGARNFIHIIGLTGGITLACEGILVNIVYLKAKSKTRMAHLFKMPSFLCYILISFLLAGIIYEIFYFIKP